MKRVIVFCATLALTLPIMTATNVDARAIAAKTPIANSSKPSPVAGKLESLARFLAIGDIPSVIAMWAPDGTYTDSAGNLYKGREVLKKHFESVMAEGGNPKVLLQTDNTRVLAPNVVLSEGTVLGTSASGEAAADTRYSILFTKQGTEWLISCASETPIEAAPAAETQQSLNDLSWMIGDWKSEHNGYSLKLHVDWAGNKNFLRWNYQISKAGQPTQDNIEVIAFNPKKGSLVSWGFDSSGSFGDGTWSMDKGAWQIDMIKTAPDGSTLTAHNIITPKNNDRFTWQSVDRTQGGLPMPETGELLIERESK